MTHISEWACQTCVLSFKDVMSLHSCASIAHRAHRRDYSGSISADATIASLVVVRLESDGTMWATDAHQLLRVKTDIRGITANINGVGVFEAFDKVRMKRAPGFDQRFPYASVAVSIDAENVSVGEALWTEDSVNVKHLPPDIRLAKHENSWPPAPGTRALGYREMVIASIDVDQELLAALCAMMRTYTKGVTLTVVDHHEGAQAIRIERKNEATALLMPMKWGTNNG